MTQYKATQWFSPYTGLRLPNGKRDASLKKTGRGVYMIAKDGFFSPEIIYVGKASTDVKKTLYRHFQKWTDRRHPDNKRAQIYERVSYTDSEITDIICKVIFCSDQKNIDAIERALIMKYTPEDNTQKLDFFTREEKTAAAKFMEKLNYGGISSIDIDNEEPPF